MTKPDIIPELSVSGTRRNRAQSVADIIKQWILVRGLVPGDRLPQEAALISELGVSKGTIREALKVLETQGIIRTRTGPGGGAFITEVTEELAVSLLGNHFFFTQVGIADIYALRKTLEPQLVRELASHISAAQIANLEECMSAYRFPPQSIDEAREQREAELEFHAALAGFSNNALLRFVCGFLVRMLKDLTVCKKIYEQPNAELREQGLAYQQQLIDAFKNNNATLAHSILESHMQMAERLMLEQEAEVKRGFLDAW